MTAEIVDATTETDRLKKELAYREVYQNQRVLQLQLQTESMNNQI